MSKWLWLTGFFQELGVEKAVSRFYLFIHLFIYFSKRGLGSRGFIAIIHPWIKLFSSYSMTSYHGWLRSERLHIFSHPWIYISMLSCGLRTVFFLVWMHLNSIILIVIFPHFYMLVFNFYSSFLEPVLSLVSNTPSTWGPSLFFLPI